MVRLVQEIAQCFETNTQEVPAAISWDYAQRRSQKVIRTIVLTIKKKLDVLYIL